MERPVHAAAPPVGPSESLLSGVWYGLGATAAGAALAFLALFPQRIPKWIYRTAVLVGKPPLAALRAVHSGHVGDYVAWLVTGVAALGGLFALFAFA